MAGRNAPHIVVSEHADGPRVTEYPSKKAAVAAGSALRASGAAETYVYSKADAAKHGLDPRAKDPASQARTSADQATMEGRHADAEQHRQAAQDLHAKAIDASQQTTGGGSGGNPNHDEKGRFSSG